MTEQPPPIALTEDQIERLWRNLESAERLAEDTKRMLGILAIEKGLEE